MASENGERKGLVPSRTTPFCRAHGYELVMQFDKDSFGIKPSVIASILAAAAEQVPDLDGVRMKVTYKGQADHLPPPVRFKDGGGS